MNIHKFYLNKEKPKGDKFPVYLRITVNRKKSELYTGHNLLESEWDDKKQRQNKKGSSIVNEDLSRIENKILEYWNILEREGKTITAEMLKGFITGKDKLEVDTLELFEVFISLKKSNPEISKPTIKHYNNTKRHLTDFIKEKKKAKDCPITSIDMNFIKEFDLFLLGAKTKKEENGLARNTINKHHSRFRSVLLFAIEKGYLTKSPYFGFKMKNEHSEREYLSKEELLKLKEHELGGNESLKKIRDIFLFSCYTGLRFQDAQNLKMEDIETDNDGSKRLVIKQQKTNGKIDNPIPSPAIEIIEKYDNNEREANGKVLPRISNQKVNTYLKAIADLVGLKTTLTHHIARHTAGTYLLSNGASIEQVSKFLGHTSIRTTQIYAKMTRDSMKEMMKKIDWV